MKILALDCATKTGWAHSGGASGVWDLSIKNDESAGMRLIRFEGKILEVKREVGVNVIAFEQASVFSGGKANTNAGKLITSMIAIIHRLCAEDDSLECMGVNLASIKAHALPNERKRDKAAMVASARQKWPERRIEDDNEADALWLLDYVQGYLGVRK